MSTEKDLDFATIALHTGQEPEKWNCRAVVPPIILSTTYKHSNPAEHSGYFYGRSGNPTRDALESCLASLEGAKYALAFASGMGAATAVAQMLHQGDHILTDHQVYLGTSCYFRHAATNFRLELGFTDFTDLAALPSVLKPNTKLVWFEASSNPLLRIADIAEVCRIVKANNPGALIVVDNTFMSPYFSSPLTLGADIVMHSMTKYINGHTDSVMGMIATNSTNLYESLKFIQKASGIVPSPFDAFLVNRGLKTLALRMERHAGNAHKIAEYLSGHAHIEKVIYPGLPSHPDHATARAQFRGFSGMIAFYIRGDVDTARRFIKELKIPTVGVSLGGCESLIEIPALMTKSSIPKDIRDRLGITDNLFRFSVGIEDVGDLIKDLDSALKAVN